MDNTRMEDKPVQPATKTNSFDAEDLIKRFLLWMFRLVGSVITSSVKAIGIFILILIFLSAIGGAFSEKADQSKGEETYISGSGGNKIVVISLHGMILSSVEPTITGSTEAITPDKVRQVLNRVAKDGSIKGVILEIDSPGGSAVASDQIYEIIQTFKKETKLPIVASLGDTAASGGYYIASTADKIVANPATITGSIGVIASTLKVQGLFDKLGLKEEVYKKGTYKDILSSTRDTTPEEKAIIDSILDDTYNLFLTRVAQGRKLSKPAVENLANGKIYSGIQAQNVGLVDNIGNLEMSISITKELAHLGDAKVVRFETGSFFDRIFSGTLFSLFKPLISHTSPLPQVWFMMN